MTTQADRQSTTNKTLLGMPERMGNHNDKHSELKDRKCQWPSKKNSAQETDGDRRHTRKKLSHTGIQTGYKDKRSF